MPKLSNSGAHEGKRGRVLAIYTAILIGSTPIGSLFFGWVGHAIGTTNALLADAGRAGAGAALTAIRARL